MENKGDSSPNNKSLTSVPKNPNNSPSEIIPGDESDQMQEQAMRGVVATDQEGGGSHEGGVGEPNKVVVESSDGDVAVVASGVQMPVVEEAGRKRKGTGFVPIKNLRADLEGGEDPNKKAKVEEDSPADQAGRRCDLELNLRCLKPQGGDGVDKGSSISKTIRLFGFDITTEVNLSENAPRDDVTKEEEPFVIAPPPQNIEQEAASVGTDEKVVEEAVKGSAVDEENEAELLPVVEEKAEVVENEVQEAFADVADGHTTTEVNPSAAAAAEGNEKMEQRAVCEIVVDEAEVKKGHEEASAEVVDMEKDKEVEASADGEIVDETGMKKELDASAAEVVMEKEDGKEVEASADAEEETESGEVKNNGDGGKVSDVEKSEVVEAADGNGDGVVGETADGVARGNQVRFDKDIDINRKLEDKENMQ